MAARFEALDAAAVALLEPVVIGQAGWRAAFGRALANFETVSGEAGFGALAELAGRLARGLPPDGPTAEGDDAQRTQAGNLAADLLDLCAGRLDPAQAAALAMGDAGLAGRMAETARRLAALRAGGPDPEGLTDAARVDDVSAAEALTDEALGDDVSLDEVLVGEMPADDIVIARDELLLLAEEAEALHDELAEAPPGAARAAILADGLARIADAAELLGLPASAGLLAAQAERLRDRADVDAAGAARFDAGFERLAERLPMALAALFRDGDASQGLLELLDHGARPGPADEPAAAQLAGEFARLRLVGSRQVQGELARDADLSLEIPPDADPSVVDSLLHELPALSAQLGERLAAFESGDREALAAAQRLAHTLKGSANTVGVRGIAAITHGLEDLLQLLAGRREPADAGLQALLGDAADCVAEMCEAVAGFGSPPAGAAALHARIVDWIGRLLGDADEAGVAGATAREWPAALGQTGGEARLEVASEAGIGMPADIEAEADVGPASGSPASAGARAVEPEIRVPAALVGRLLSLVDEAAILVAHASEQATELERSRGTLRLGGDQLQDLASELERIVDVRGLALNEQRTRQSLDPLELDEYNDLHTVSRRIAESGADGKLVEQQLGAHVAALRDSLARLERLQAELRDCALQTRMAAFGSVVPRLRRTVRQAARMAGREAVLAVAGEDTLVEAGMLSKLVDALAHLLRNAVDHGIESPARRSELGKPAAGEIRLSVAREGTYLKLVCSDDGQGLDLAAARERALAAGLLAPDSPATPEVLHPLLMAPGFSTRARASQLSGRGIGLDVVRQAVDGLRGTIAIDSVAGQGTRFTMSVPLGLASLPVLLLRAPGRPLVLALSVRGIERIVPAPPAGVVALQADGSHWPISTIEALLGLPDESFVAEADVPGAGDRSRSALLLRLPDGRPAALRVPEPEAPRSVVVRPMPAHLSQLPGIDGVAVLGDGAVAPVLDPVGLLVAEADGTLGARAPWPAVRSPARRTAPLCLVVDDSVSVRRTTEIFVRDLGFEVEGAADGVEALERMRRQVPDLALVDMEMPRMNGLELVRAMRADSGMAEVAVIMITSRYSERHKHLALEAGVDVFLTKPYTEDSLATRIIECLERRRPPERPERG